MSSVTTSSVSVNTSTPSTPVSPAERHEQVLAEAKAHCEEHGIHNLGDVPMYQQATAEQQAALERDMGTMLAEGMDKWEYLEGVNTWGGDAASYLAESSQAEPTADHPATQAAVDAAAKAEQAKQSAEQAAEDARAASVATLQALVKVYKRGERAYSECLLESGRLARQYVSQRMAINPKERAAAVQQLGSSLGMWSSSVVDGPYVNRLMAAAAAADLLADGQELGEKQLKAVPYGHYRDAWSLLVERVKTDDGEEYVLLAGVEEMCRTHFKRAVTESLSRESAIDWAKTCQREQLVQQTQAKAVAEAAAKAARIKAEQEAAEARKQTQAAAAQKEAALKAAEQANAAAEAAAEEVVAAAKTGDAEAAEAAKQESERLQAEAKAKQEQAVQARLQAEAQAKAHETARLEAELKAKQESRAKEEARVASERQATAEAKKAEQDRKAAEREANKGQRKAAPAAGTNLVPTAKDASPKDVAEWMAKSMLANSNPDAVFVELLALLVHTPTESPVAAFRHEGVQDAIMAAAWSLQDSLDKADAAAKAKQESAEEPSDAELAKLETAGVA